jgi:hypothetical protein
MRCQMLVNAQTMLQIVSDVSAFVRSDQVVTDQMGGENVASDGALASPPMTRRLAGCGSFDLPGVVAGWWFHTLNTGLIAIPTPSHPTPRALNRTSTVRIRLNEQG